MALVVLFLVAVITAYAITGILYLLWRIIKENFWLIITASAGFLTLAIVWLNNP